MSLWRGLICALFGHPDSHVEWGAWTVDPEVGCYRVLTERCSRCRAVLALSTLVEGESWR